MAEYIEREAAFNAVLKLVPKVDDDGYCWVIRGDAATAIDNIPAADVRPVVKATWKRIDFNPCGHDYECSSCGWKNDMATHFCPNCGAKMEKS